MDHLICKVIDFEIIGPYTVTVFFDDGSTQVIDFLPALKGELYGPLQDIRLFNQLKLDPEIHALVWPNGADFDPETLYNWPKYSKEIERRTGFWEQSHTNKLSLIWRVASLVGACVTGAVGEYAEPVIIFPL